MDDGVDFGGDEVDMSVGEDIDHNHFFFYIYIYYFPCRLSQSRSVLGRGHRAHYAFLRVSE